MGMHEPVKDPAQVRIEVVKKINDEQFRHQQSCWTSNAGSTLVSDILENPCGTSACAAGWASLVAAPAGTVLESTASLHFPDGEMRHVMDFGQEALGLERKSAVYLFGETGNEEARLLLKWLAEHPESREIPHEVRGDARQKAYGCSW
jgi:hypothetical protein